MNAELGAAERWSDLFEQTFVGGANTTRKASSVFVSFLIQCGLVVVGDSHSVNLHGKLSQRQSLPVSSWRLRRRRLRRLPRLLLP